MVFDYAFGIDCGFDEDAYGEDDLMNESVYDLLRKIEYSVKQKYESRIKKLEQELNELKDFKKDRDGLVNEIKSLKWKLEESEKNARTKAANMRLKDIIEVASKPCYGLALNCRYIYDKCDKCDDHRYIHFSSPSGRDMSEPCKCSERVWEYSVEPAHLMSICTYDYSDSELKGIQLKHAIDSDFVAFMESDECDSYSYTEKRIFYNGQRFDELTDYQIRLLYFRNKEDAESAAAYLNEKNNGKK